MKLLVVGATKGIGRQVVDAALAQGHEVRAMARSADEMPDLDRLERLKGDALEGEDVARALDGVEAVVHVLGIKESIAMLWEEVTLFSRSTAVFLQEMPKAGVTRLIAITGFGAGRSRDAMSLIERTGHRAILGKPYEDKDRQEAMIMASDLDYTIVRPTILTNRPARGTCQVLTDPGQWRNGLISRADVAGFVMRELEAGAHIRQDVVITR